MKLNGGIAININDGKFQYIPDPEDMTTYRKAGPFIFITGQVGINAEGEAMKDPSEQISQAYKNFDQALKEAGVSRNQVVKLNHYIADRKHLPEVIRNRKEFFNSPYPASTGLISELGHPDHIYEIEGIAYTEEM